MVERVDKVEGQIMTVRSTLKTEAYLAADYKSQQLKTEIMGEVNQRLTALETHLTHQMNEDRQTMANRLQEINDLVAADREGQQKTWGAIERINKDLQELIQKDAGTDGEDGVDPVPAATNWDIPESAPVGKSSIGTPWSWLEGIPEEEESNVKDSVTSGLLPNSQLRVQKLVGLVNN